jgi:hypothetical protein
VLAAAIAQVPARFRSRLLVRVDGAGASHELIAHLLSLATPRRTVPLTCGWMITPADEDAIKMLPATAWQPGLDQDGEVQEDKHVAEITHLMSRAGRWPDGLRWIGRRTKPARRQARNLTAFEKATGWRYSIICMNIPAAGIPGVPGSHHPQVIDVLHREHAIVEDGVRHGKSMRLRNLPYVEVLAGQLRLGHRRRPGRLDPATRPLRPGRPARRRPGHAPLPDLAHSGPPGPARPPARAEDQPALAMEGGVPDLLAAAVRPTRTRLTSTIPPLQHERHPGAVGAGAVTERTRAATHASMPAAVLTWEFGFPCHSFNRRVSYVVVVSGSGQHLRLQPTTSPGSRLRRRLVHSDANCADHDTRCRLVHVWSTEDGRRLDSRLAGDQ